MLVLSRKLHESIQIGDDIVLTVLAIHGGSVKLGIKAPVAIPVHRMEVFRAISGSPTRPPPVAVVPTA